MKGDGLLVHDTGMRVFRTSASETMRERKGTFRFDIVFESNLTVSGIGARIEKVARRASP
jgi:hypothetical protein